MYNTTLNEYEQKNIQMKSYLKELQNKISSKNINFQEI